MRRFLTRWDLDKTYLRTDFDSVRDLLRTAMERADQKRTVPGAGSLLRELSAAGGAVHIVSGSPKQLRGKIEEKLRLDGAVFETLTLKPNLENFLKLRLRAVRDQLGYKLPTLMNLRAALAEPRDDEGVVVPEICFGDDAEADAFVYSLYADICSGGVDLEALAMVLERGRVYEDNVAVALDAYPRIEKGDVVQRIFIHLEGQSPPSRFAVYGPRVVPFYNYLQPAFVLGEDGFLPPEGVLRVAAELVDVHRFDAEGLARSYLELRRRGSARGTLVDSLAKALPDLVLPPRSQALRQLERMCERLDTSLPALSPVATREVVPLPDYASLVLDHNKRHKRKGGNLFGA
jgi:hypothetical protein